MIRNRSMPDDVVVPVLAYPSVTEAVNWLVQAFGFTRRWQIEDHRAQLGVGTSAGVAITQGAVVATEDHVMVRVQDVDAHRAQALAAGARVSEATDHFYGERQYSAVDPSGRLWLFSQSVADLDPSEWGATTFEPDDAGVGEEEAR